MYYDIQQIDENKQLKDGLILGPIVITSEQVNTLFLLLRNTLVNSNKFRYQLE